MAVRCAYCGREYDVTLFEFGRSVTCVCGKRVEFRHKWMSVESFLALSIEEEKVREIQALADRISSLIVSSDYPMIDIEIEKQKLRELIEELLPEKIGLYDLIYESRFQRLKEQFRDSENL